MSDSKPKTIWDLNFKKKKTVSGALDGASTSGTAAAAGPSSTRKRTISQIKEEIDSDAEETQLGLLDDEDPKLGGDVTAKLLKRREKRIRKKDEPGTLITTKDLTPTVRFTNTRKVTRGDLIALTHHAETVQKVMKLDRQTEADWAEMRQALWEIPFCNVNHTTIRSSGALSRLVELEDDQGVPPDVENEIAIILKRWRNHDFDPELLRGIDLTQTVKRGGSGGAKGTKRGRTYRIEEGYRFKKDPQVEGHNGLLVGEWWPLQICALRDGAHGELEAGISGNQQRGCLSVIVAGGSLYPDLDEVDRVLYCGTMGFAVSPGYSGEYAEGLGPGDRIPSPNTNLLLLSFRNNTQIRLLRSYKAKSAFAPVDGLRYDGLYRIRSYELLDKKNAVYRFEMIREPHQSPIRGNRDIPGAKPHEVELKIWKGVQKTLKGER